MNLKKVIVFGGLLFGLCYCVAAQPQDTIIGGDTRAASDRCEVKESTDTGKDGDRWAQMISLTLVIVSTVASVIVYIVQQQQRQSQSFKTCSQSLYSDNEIEQAAAAIMLRGFLKKRPFNIDYSKQAIRLMIALLKTHVPIPVTLQKNLADGFSFASKMDGLDMQYTNMQGCLIKPPSRISYELTNKRRYKLRRVSMKKADFYHAVVKECSINNVNAKGAIFQYSIMCDTSFKNCLLNDADFKGANIENVVFDVDCDLEGASFVNAVGIKDAFVKRRKGDSVEKVNLVKFLDEKGKYHETRPGSYKISEERERIFVSKLGVLSTQQQLQVKNVEDLLKEKYELDTIDRSSYRPTAQLNDIDTHLERCDGCIIFAFEYLDVKSGIIHKNVIGKDKRTVENQFFASPWLQIETALANRKRMPCLIIGDEALCRDGMFDEAIVRPDRNLFFMTYSDDTKKLNDIIMKWASEVREYSTNKAGA